MTVKFLHAADLHLDSPLRGLESDGAPAELIRDATRRALGKLVDLALDEDVDLLLIAGDIYDGDWPHYGTGRYFGAQMARLTRAGKPVIAIRGNHDAENRMTRSLRLPDGVKVLDHRRPETVELPALGLAVHGQSFATREGAEVDVRAYPRALPGVVNIGLLHTCLDQPGVHERYAPCARADLEALGYNYWALGHIHAREVVSESPWIVYPGNLQGRHVNETGPKGATLVTIEGDRITPEPRTVDDFRWERIGVDLTGCATEEAVMARVATALEVAWEAAEGRGLGVRLTLRGETGPLGRDLKEKAANEAQQISPLIWIESVEVATSTPNVALKERADALGALARHIEELAAAPPAGLLGDWPAQLLARLPPRALPDDHPLNDPARVLARARDLLLARLEEG
jgi:DNA repair exonuclease SbcCD nuclease subunit